MLIGATRMSWAATTIYLGVYIPPPPGGIAYKGYVDTLDEAKAAFKDSFDKLIGVGAVRIERARCLMP